MFPGGIYQILSIHMCFKTRLYIREVVATILHHPRVEYSRKDNKRGRCQTYDKKQTDTSSWGKKASHYTSFHRCEKSKPVSWLPLFASAGGGARHPWLALYKKINKYLGRLPNPVFIAQIINYRRGAFCPRIWRLPVFLGASNKQRIFWIARF